MWFLDLAGSLIYVVVDGVKKEVDSISAANKYVFVEVTLKSGKICMLSLTEFEANRSEFSSRFGKTASRTHFLNVWNNIVAETGNLYEPGLEEHVQTEGVLGNDNSYSGPSKGQSVLGINDQQLKESYLGTYDVHIMNLSAPVDENSVRDVDYQHVKNLELSFTEAAFSQLVILSGIVKNDNCLLDLAQREATEKVHILGGNHTRLALQSLHDKGLIAMDCVKVNLYKPLHKSLALAVAFQHNELLEEKKKTMSFFDKVKVMRNCRPAEVMTHSQRKDWKDILCVIFRAENRKRLQSRFHVHMHIAEFGEQLFKKCSAINEKCSVTERRMKQVIKLDDESIQECIEVWLQFGIGRFFCQNMTKKSKKKASDNESDLMIQDSYDGTLADGIDSETHGCVELDKPSNEDLLKRIQHLEEQNSALRQQVKENKKRKANDDVLFEHGDSVEGMWNDGEFYPAHIEKLEIYYHIIFDDDNVKKRVKRDSLRQITNKSNEL